MVSLESGAGDLFISFAFLISSKEYLMILMI